MKIFLELISHFHRFLSALGRHSRNRHATFRRNGGRALQVRHWAVFGPGAGPAAFIKIYLLTANFRLKRHARGLRKSNPKQCPNRLQSRGGFWRVCIASGSDLSHTIEYLKGWSIIGKNVHTEQEAQGRAARREHARLQTRLSSFVFSREWPFSINVFLRKFVVGINVVLNFASLILFDCFFAPCLLLQQSRTVRC